ncbi:hypothetical protein GCM10010387_62050 [Streptomyces inusitatus]|uniref:Uncharacterized protein n=2 Tax=Streptomyces inusitatus TaxID=68221 RepID=A0A918QNP3_9ACTN|nr:hypothetical protein GCM10010387_62050 [Streptomyces inusitatus]
MQAVKVVIMEPINPLSLVDWAKRNAVRLGTPINDLVTLRRLIGGARVVALGEYSHQIREFGLLREQILRHLVMECGLPFTLQNLMPSPAAVNVPHTTLTADINE